MAFYTILLSIIKYHSTKTVERMMWLSTSENQVEHN